MAHHPSPKTKPAKPTKPTRRAKQDADSPFKIGQAYLIRTVTMIVTGRVVKRRGHFLVLDQGAWIADTGRFANALAEGEKVLDEVEPAPGEGMVIVGMASIVDAYPWSHALPRTQK